MPEFVLDTANASTAWLALDDFAKGFIEAALFCETCSGLDSSEFFGAEAQEDIAQGRADGNIPSDAGVADIDPESLARVAAFCREFQGCAAALLTAAYERNGYDESQAGRDLYYTRAGHGVGYWERKALESDSAEYEDLTRQMIEAGANSAAWNAACAKRFAIAEQSLGNRLTEAAGRGEIYLEAYESEASDSGFFVRFDIA